MTLTRSSGDLNQVFRYRGFLIRNRSKMKPHSHETKKQAVEVSFPVYNCHNLSTYFCPSRFNHYSLLIPAPFPHWEGLYLNSVVKLSIWSSGKRILPNRSQATFIRSSGDPSTGLQVQRISDQKHNQWHRHALQVTLTRSSGDPN